MRVLDADSQEAIHRLWDELADLDQSRFGAATRKLMTFHAGRDDIINVTWAGAVRLTSGERALSDDVMRRWRVAAVDSLRSYVPPPHRIWDRPESDPSFDLPMRGLGRFRSYSFRRELPPEWFDTPFYRQHYGDHGIADAAFVAFPLNADSESHFGFWASRPLADESIARLAYTLRGIKWLHRHLMLSHGLTVASAPLTPTERKVLALLLTEATEKQIAQRLALAASTTHQHVQALFRKFGTRNRAGLMSLWLGGRK
jgi:DNA-binding CsgD family transcriptional regulator